MVIDNKNDKEELTYEEATIALIEFISKSTNIRSIEQYILERKSVKDWLIAISKKSCGYS